MMKKLISLVLCAMLLLGCMTFAQADTQQESGSAVDIVLLIDQSGSTWYDNPNTAAVEASDPDGLRLDAAQMVIALLGMNGSRVAYVPFAARVYNNADDDFHTISGVNDYRDKMKDCEELRNNWDSAANSGGTDFAEALAYAYNLLASRSDDSNQPMIILLTDGSLNLESTDKQPRIQKPYYTWNAQTQRFDPTGNDVMVWESKSASRNATYYASELLESAITACVDKEYPVYTVALDADTTSEHYQTLNGISTRTGAGTAVAIKKNDEEGLQKLPAYFGDMFASRIGSSELQVLTATCVNAAENLYEVQFVIPNKSVMEANLFVPKAGISNPYLLDADEKKPTQSTVTELTSENFVLYKLTNPTPYGTWKLRFTKTNDKADVSFNLLYNYDVTLRGYVGVAGEYASYDVGHTFQRGDKLSFSAKFYDNREDRLSEDTRLYDYPDEPGDVDDWCTMNVSYSLRRVTGNTSQPVYNSSVENADPMVASGAQFYVELDMKEISNDAEGYNTLAAGDYYLTVYVEGSGLVREVNIPFTLANSVPSRQGGSINLSREVDGDDPSTHEATPAIHDVSAYVQDYDNDKIVSEFEQLTGTDVVTLTYDRDSKQIVSVPVQGADGKLAYGTATGKLTIREYNSDVQTVIPVTMNVTSGNDELNRRWNLSVDAGDVQEKNNPFDIKLKLLLTDGGTPDRSNEVDKVTAKITIVDTATNEAVVNNAAMTLGDDKVFIYTHTTGANKGTWKVTVTTYQGELPIKTATDEFSVENHGPVAKIAAEELVIYHNPLPEFLSFLGETTTEEDRTLDLSTYFDESDNETLIYVEETAPNGNLLKITQTAETWVLEAVKGANSKTEFKVKAVDNDGEATDVITFEVQLVDLVQVWTQRGLIALAALVALIIFIMIVRQALKPKFPKGAVLGVREGSSDYDTSSYEFVPSKKPISLAAVIMTDTAAKFGISANALTNIELVPVRSTNYSIGVRLKKKMDDVTVSLTSKSVGKGKKPTVWAPGDSLILNSRNNTTGVELNVVLFPPENLVMAGGGAAMVDEDPFQVNDVSGFGGFNSDVNAFGANDVSGSFGGLAPVDDFSASSSSSNDSGFSVSMGDDSGAESFSNDSGSSDDFTIGF